MMAMKPREKRSVQDPSTLFTRIKTLDNVLAQSMIWLRDNQLQLPGSLMDKEDDARIFAELIVDRDSLEEKWTELKGFKLLGDENTRAGKKYNFRKLDAAETSAVDLEIRHLALEHKVNLQTVERIRKTFDLFDHDASGTLESQEIKPLLLKLLNVKNAEDLSQARLEFLARQFLANNKACDFSNFLANYLRLFGSEKSAPETVFYAALNPMHAAIANMNR